MSIDIKDNFLSPQTLGELHKCLYSHTFPWFWMFVVNDDEVEEDLQDNYQLQHVFYDDNLARSKFLLHMDPLLTKIQTRGLLRVMANLNYRTTNIIKHGFHNDWDYEDSKTSIFYVNTNDGYTEFEDGTVVESVENRLVTFPSPLKHTGTSCTDTSRRMVININYF